MPNNNDWDDALSYYRREFEQFEHAVRRAGITSFGGGALITSHRREVYCTTLFTKLAVTARTLLSLCPDPRHASFYNSHLDFSSAAAVTRVLIDTFVSLYHLGLEECAEDESETRMLLVFWRDFRVRNKLHMGLGNRESAQQADEFHTKNLTERLSANAFFQSLPEKRRRHLLKKNDLLYTPEEILARSGFDIDFHRGYYAYLSAHAHCDSVAFMFMDERNRGMGQINTGDISMLGTSVEYARKILTFATDAFELVIPGSEARGKSVKGLDPLSNRFPQSVPWAGRKISDVKQEKS